MHSLQVLAIAPYEGLGELITEVAEKNYPGVNVTVLLGDLEKGLAAARSRDISKYDVILSRGGTADLLSRNLPLPVVGMDPTILDVLRHIRMAKAMTKSYAIVAFPAIAEIASKVFALMNQEESIHVIQSTSDAEDTVRLLKSSGCELIIGDAIAVSFARELNLNSILITSGRESVENAFSEAIRLNTLLAPLNEKVSELRAMLSSVPEPVFSLSESGDVRYSFFPESCTDRELLLAKAKEILPSIDKSVPFSMTLRTEACIWRLTGETVSDANARFFVFFAEKKKSFFPERKNPVKMIRASSYIQLSDVTDKIGQMKAVSEQAEKIGKKRFPVLIMGEPGTPVDDVLGTVIQSAGRKSSMLFIIDCSRLDIAFSKRLLESEDSPLMDNDQVFCFKNVNMLPDEIAFAWFEFAKVTKVSNRNLIVYCAEEPLNQNFTGFLNASGTHCLYLPPIRERIEDIPSLAGLYVNECNVAAGRQVIGIAPEALRLMTDYSWPGNNEQLRLVIQQAFLSSVGDYLLLENIAPCLKSFCSKGSRLSDTSSSDFSGTLDDICIRAAKAVLKEENGNRLRTAERLNISRSTLWRMLKENGSDN